jgi:hypothetical protein
MPNDIADKFSKNNLSVGRASATNPWDFNTSPNLPRAIPAVRPSLTSKRQRAMYRSACCESVRTTKSATSSAEPPGITSRLMRWRGDLARPSH